MNSAQDAARVDIVRESQRCRVNPPTVSVSQGGEVEFFSIDVEEATIFFPRGVVKPSEPQTIRKGDSFVFTATGLPGSYPYVVFCGGEGRPFELAEGNSEPRMIIR
jgi:plastocyanin